MTIFVSIADNVLADLRSVVRKSNNDSSITVLQGYLTSLWRNSSGYLRRVPVEHRNLDKIYSTFVVDEKLYTRFRLFIKELIMALNTSDTLHPSLRPPDCVQGMTTLTRDRFAKTVKVPGLKLPKKQISLTQKSWKPFLLKLKGLKPIACLDSNDPLSESHNLILFDPAKIEGCSEEPWLLDKLHKLGVSPQSLEKYDLDIGYDNWSVSDVMKAVLPQGADNVSSFTQIGHIAHLNLKEENLLFKHIIGEVIIDKIASVKTVVNKLNSIDNTYRNFEMELLAGEKNFVTQTREHNCVFELDFSKVYWNSRLSTEHHRIVDVVPKSSVVYDVFAGVGPFTVPLGKRKDCTIFANDLNPYSYKSLEKNIELNKLKSGSVNTYNMDGRDFIKNVVKHDLSKRIEAAHLRHCGSKVTDQSNSSELLDEKSLQAVSLPEDVANVKACTIAVMNLPALAVEFLDAFVSLLSDLPTKFRDPKLIDPILPTIYCYAFCSKKDDVEAEIKKRAESVLNQSLPDDTVVRIVRNVSPNKEMVCLTFKLWSDVVLAVDGRSSVKVKDPDQELPEPDCKKLKHS